MSNQPQVTAVTQETPAAQTPEQIKAANMASLKKQYTRDVLKTVGTSVVAGPVAIGVVAAAFVLRHYIHAGITLAVNKMTSASSAE